MSYEWALSDAGDEIAIELADDSDRWTISIAPLVPRTEDLQLTMPPPPSDPPTFYAGDPVRTLVAPPPPAVNATVRFTGASSEPPATFVLTVNDGSLAYDASTGVLAGTIPSLGSAAIYGALAIDGQIARPITCDGPSRCTTTLEDAFSLSQMIWIQPR